MRIRDAVEADAGRLASIADTPSDVMRNLVHDRTVRVAEAVGEEDPNADVDTDPAASPDATPEDPIGEDDSGELLGFVSFDAREGVVHVTQVEGTREACEQLLGEPVRFARRERMEVELLVPDPETDTREAAETVGFEEAGTGPRFEGIPTVRYRMKP